MFKSQTYGKLNIEEIPQKLLEYYDAHKSNEMPISIIVGTDSQNFHKTKMVSVVCILCEGNGGIFFYEVTDKERITDVRRKLYTETQDSLNIATKLVEIMENDKTYEQLYLNCPISIHVDAGNSPHGKTKELIPALVGWITAMGYEASVKPESFVASTIADKISK